MELSSARLAAVAQFLRAGGYAGELKLLPMGESEPFTGVDRSLFPAMSCSSSIVGSNCASMSRVRPVLMDRRARRVESQPSGQAKPVEPTAIGKVSLSPAGRSNSAFGCACRAFRRR